MSDSDPALATAAMRESMPLAATLGFEAVSTSAEDVIARLAWAPGLCTVGGVPHGGALMVLADTTGALCAFLDLPDGATGTSTIESKTNSLGAVNEGVVIARSLPLHAGGSTVVVETELRADERLVGKVTHTQVVLRARS
jgi:uncharacterized protein (TIGR00369 family)